MSCTLLRYDQHCMPYLRPLHGLCMLAQYSLSSYTFASAHLLKQTAHCIPSTVIMFREPGTRYQNHTSGYGANVREVPPSPAPHADYYFEDGNLIVLVSLLGITVKRSAN